MVASSDLFSVFAVSTSTFNRSNFPVLPLRCLQVSYTNFCLLSRPFVDKVETAVQNAKDEKDAELARNVRKADLEQIVAKVSKDMEVLQKHLSPAEDRRAEEHALDMKYLRDRQQPPGLYSFF